jgi:hypothetical protein
MERWNLRQGVIDIFIIIIILLNIIDFFRLLPHDLDVFKKIFSWVSLGLIMYNVNLAKLIFGQESHENMKTRFGVRPSDVNLFILISYFLLIIKDFTQFAGGLYESAINEAFISKGIIYFIQLNADIIDAVTFLSGSGLLFLLSIYLAFDYDFRKPSIMHLVHEDGSAKKNWHDILKRIVTIFIILLSFYIIVFNFLMEWLAFVIDASIIVLGILFYIYIMVRFRRHFKVKELIHKIGHFGESFYEEFINLFYTWKGILIGIIGIQVLHLVADTINILMPLLFNAKDTLYGHTYPFILNLYLADIMPLSAIDRVFILWNYVFSLIGFILLMFFPAYLWWHMYKNKRINLSGFTYAVFFASIISFFFSRIFSLSVNDITIPRSTIGINMFIDQFNGILSSFNIFLLSLTAFVGALILFHFSKKTIKSVFITIITFFLGWYLFCFCYDLFNMLISDILANIMGKRFIYTIIQSIFFIILLGYYVSGYGRFIQNAYTMIIKNKKTNKKINIEGFDKPYI